MCERDVNVPKAEADRLDSRALKVRQGERRLQSQELRAKRAAFLEAERRRKEAEAADKLEEARRQSEREAAEREAREAAYCISLLGEVEVQTTAPNTLLKRSGGVERLVQGRQAQGVGRTQRVEALVESAEGAMEEVGQLAGGMDTLPLLWRALGQEGQTLAAQSAPREDPTAPPSPSSLLMDELELQHWL
ncbi:hypothetical protein HaLaN_02805, partial [Haematococcus lacustris]